MLDLVAHNKEIDTKSFMSETKFFESYSRWIDEEERYESWNEAIERVMNMHREFYADKMTPELAEAIDFAEKMYKNKRVLGAQRALQFGGDQILKHQMKLYNCFSRDTKFVTKLGIRSFDDYTDGDTVSVLTHTGKWKTATVKNYGKQILNSVTFTKGANEKRIKVTENHRWILHDGVETTSLKVGDRILKEPLVFGKFDWDSASVDEQLYWLYGYVYGDGTINNGYSLVRLCGKDRKYKNRFESFGFKTSSSNSLEGDFIAYTGSYKKTLPDPLIDSPVMIRAFVAGYLSADGKKNTNYGGEQYNSIQASGEESIAFIRECFPIAGVHIISENDLTGEETNYGIRPYTIRFTICDSSGSKYNSGWKVRSIEESHEDTVWCLEVEDDNSFVLESGIVTGNCTSTHIDRAEVFGELFYILLCGAGAGFSVQKHHVAKLPKIGERKKQAKQFIPDDSIEGWADCVDVLLSSYFVGGGKHPEYEGRKVYFDLSKIRPRGSKISGGFKAPGPEPLRRALDLIEYLIQGLILKGEKSLKPIHVYDIIMYIADAVLSGGVRRSATICLFSPDDQDMLKAKTGNWMEENPQRKRSNNSALIVRDELTLEQFKEIMVSVKEFGEPGFIFASSKEHAFNPCVTKDTWVTTENGARKVEDLINKGKQKVLINGEYHDTTEHGFVQTGVNIIQKVTLDNGSELRLTDNHKVMTTEGWKEVKDLTSDDYIMLSNNSNRDIGELNNKSFSEGWLIGNLIGGGTFDSKGAVWRYWGDEKSLNETCSQYLSEIGLDTKINRDYDNERLMKEHVVKNDFISIYSSRFADYISAKYGVKRNSKTINESLEKSSDSIVRGLVSGLFDADGSVYGGPKNGIRVDISSNDIEMLKSVQRIMNRFGVPSKISQSRPAGWSTLPDGKGGEKDYWAKAVYVLYVSGKTNCERFFNVFEPKNIVKSQKFEDILSMYTKNNYNNVKSFMTKIVNIARDGVEAVYDCAVPKVTSFEANGIHVHNCVEVGMLPVWHNVDGTTESGWQGCNLTEINGGKCNTLEDFIAACEAAAILGTLQAGYTDFKFIPDTSKKIFEREALLGVSITGWMNSPDVLFNEKNLEKGAKHVLAINEKIAAIIGINPSARACNVKPSGNASVILMTASGIHAEEAMKALRHVTINKESEVVQLIRKMNPYMVEESLHSSGRTDYTVAFPIIAKEGSITKKDITAIEFLEKVKLVQQTWVEYGTRKERCVDDTLRHNVSNTVTVGKNEWDDVTNYLFDNRYSFAGVSFMGEFGDKAFAQAPFAEILMEDEIVKRYGRASMFASGLIVDTFKGFSELWEACNFAINNGDMGGEQSDMRADWVRRFKKFANTYFEGNLNETADCLKSVYYLHKWTKIQDNLVNIDFVKELESKKYIDVDTLSAAACSGGSCEIDF